jgi:hypothetical protein
VLHDGEVGLPWIMHVEADLLDGVDDVEMDERQVLEGLNEDLKCVGSATEGPDSIETLACMFTDVGTGLQFTMPARSRISRTN